MFEKGFRKDRTRREKLDAENKLCDVQYDFFFLTSKIVYNICVIGCLWAQKKKKSGVLPWISMAQSSGY